MDWATRRPLDRFGLLAIVLGGHWLLLEVFFGGRLAESRKVAVDSLESWIWIPVTPEIPREQHERENNVGRRRTQVARTGPTEPPAAVSAVVPGVAPAVAPAVAAPPSEPTAEGVPDWIAEAHSVANSLAPRLIDELKEKCAAAERLAQALPAGCKKRSFTKDWQPEPQRAGLVGIFPYVRIGKCVIGLGFWGCAVQSPSPDGTLLEDIRNPDRPVSSVPDLPVQTFPQAPIPQAFK
ncbi:MAG: hypothetical protein JSR66_09030 [Proteobacteria bacterium]|nr:hypothetical protein [Pseudomonadota bacterium]